MSPGIATAFEVAHLALQMIQQAQQEARDVSDAELANLSGGLQQRIDAFQAKLQRDRGDGDGQA